MNEQKERLAPLADGESTPGQCPDCEGWGFIKGRADEDCPTCKGSGWPVPDSKGGKS
jgi:DnaJ-class molecular chaperone